MHEIAVNVVVHYISQRISCVFMFVYNGLNTLCGVFILHLLIKKGEGLLACCMHVFSSISIKDMPLDLLIVVCKC